MTRSMLLLLSMFGLLSNCGLIKKVFQNKDIKIEATENKKAPKDTFDSNIPATSITAVVVNPIDSANSALLKKYTRYVGFTPDSAINFKLYRFIDNWWGTPFRWGGTNENGIDCSAFIQRLLKDVYDLKLPRTSIQQLYTNRVEVFTSAKYLAEGDIVFFRTIDNTLVSHVGIYLQNQCFVHCCLSKGVTISNLQDPVWKKSYVASGRIKAHLAKN